MANRIEEIVAKLAEPIALENGLLIYDVEFKKEGPDYYLRVFIDKEDGGISIDDCEAVSRPLSDVLDKEDPIDVGYYLEVSSPGIERELKKQRDFERFLDNKIQIKFFAPFNGTKKIQAVLKGRNESITTIELDNGEIVEITNDKISKVNLVAEF